MHDMNIKLPKHITEDYETITDIDIGDYYTAILDKYGGFCNDCKHFDEELSFCLKNFHPREYAMKIGAYETSWLRKKCKCYIERPISEDERERMAKAVGRQYGCLLDYACQMG